MTTDLTPDASTFAVPTNAKARVTRQVLTVTAGAGGGGDGVAGSAGTVVQLAMR